MKWGEVMSKIGDVVIAREQDFYSMAAEDFQKKYGDKIWFQMIDSYLDELSGFYDDKLERLEELGV